MMSAYPASRFHIRASVSTMKNSVSTESELASNSQGPARQVSAATARTPRTARRSGLLPEVIGSPSCEQALRTQDERDEEDEMLGEDLPGGVDLRAEILRDPDDHAARERAPKAAETAEHDRLEGGEQAARPGRRIEIGPD